jgi:hypothetical protein
MAIALGVMLLPMVCSAATLSPRADELQQGARGCRSSGGDLVLCANFQEVQRFCTRREYWRWADCVALREMMALEKDYDGGPVAVDFDADFARCARENKALCWRRICELAVLVPTLSDANLQQCVRHLAFRKGPNWFEIARPGGDDPSSAWIICKGLIETFDPIGRMTRRHAVTQVNALPSGAFRFDRSDTTFPSFSAAASAGCDHAVSKMGADASR